MSFWLFIASGIAFSLGLIFAAVPRTKGAAGYISFSMWMVTLAMLSRILERLP